MASADKNPPTVVDPHEHDEDPEQLLGAVLLDPWDDKTQIDWPNNEDKTDEVQDEEPVVEEFSDDRDNVEVID